MALRPQCWDISVFLLCQKLAVPLKFSEAPPQSPAEASDHLMGVALQFGNNQHTGYITVEVTKLIVYNHYNTIHGDFTYNHILMICIHDK